jgi:hypothetical protein
MTTEATAQTVEQTQAENHPFENIKVDPEKSRVAPGLYKPQPEETIIEWKAPSRVFKKRNRQFFTSIVVIALLISLILFFAGQFLPIAVVVSVVFLVYVISVVPPHEVDYRISTYGIRIEKDLYYWEELGRFWLDEKFNQKTLNIELFRFPGRLSLVIKDQDENTLDQVFSEVLLKEKPELTQFEKAAKWLQEKIPLD